MINRNEISLKLADPTHHSPECQVEVEPDWGPPEELRRDDLRLEDVRRRDHRHHEDEGADVADLLREDPLPPEPRSHLVSLVLSR